MTTRDAAPGEFLAGRAGRGVSGRDRGVRVVGAVEILRDSTFVTAMTRAIRMKLQPNEEQEQMALMRWAALMTDKHPELSLLYAVPNGARTSMSVARRLKAAGLRAGVPDLHLPVARHGFHGLWLELKRQIGGVVSPEQAWWHERLEHEGQRVLICRGAEVAIAGLTWYLAI